MARMQPYQFAPWEMPSQHPDHTLLRTHLLKYLIELSLVFCDKRDGHGQIFAVATGPRVVREALWCGNNISNHRQRKLRKVIGVFTDGFYRVGVREILYRAIFSHPPMLPH